jgi:hypothetical protein
MGDPGLEPGTSSLSEKSRCRVQSSPVANKPANRLKTGSARRLETTADDNLMHPPCTPESEVSVDVPMTLAR